MCDEIIAVTRKLFRGISKKMIIASLVEWNTYSNNHHSYRKHDLDLYFSQHRAETRFYTIAISYFKVKVKAALVW